jgi:hypothetical protein
MNILLLTPDAVGGTLLNRTLAIYSQFHQFNKPVIDVGHIEIGLQKYYSTHFNQEIVTSVSDMFFQSLKEIQDMLKSVDHYKIAKLPHYNMLSRQDPIDQLLPFYQYLNQNYFIIACRRNNLFEHAISWSLNKITQTLNVYDPHNKIVRFFNMYKDKVKIDPISLTHSLEDYRKYLSWCENNFKIASYYVYETHSSNIEEYILSLPMFNGQKKLFTWKDVYGQEFNDWNKCHYFSSDLSTLSLSTSNAPELLIDSATVDNQSIADNMVKYWDIFVEKYNMVAGTSWPEIKTFADFDNLPDWIKNECREVHDITREIDLIYQSKDMIENKYSRKKLKLNGNQIDSASRNQIIRVQDYLKSHHKDFLDQHETNYKIAKKSIEQMQEIGILQNTIPIKKQTLAEKKFIVKNFEECIEVYNNWISKYPDLGNPISDKVLTYDMQEENKKWNVDRNNLLSITNEKLKK